MALCNAVLVIYHDSMFWQEDADSIAEFGRFEDSLSLPDVRDVPTAVTIAIQFLKLHAQPQVSQALELLSNAPDDYDLGDTLTADGETGLRCVGDTYTIEPVTRRLIRTPELSTALEEMVAREQRRLDRLIQAAAGLFSTSATPLDIGTKVPVGQLGTSDLASWNWSKAEELDNPWDPSVEPGDGGVWGNPYPVDNPARLYEWQVKARRTNDDGDVLTDGPSQFKIYINDVDTGLSITLTADDTDGIQQIYKIGMLQKGDVVRPVNISNGGHEQGTITLRVTDPN